MKGNDMAESSWENETLVEVHVGEFGEPKQSIDARVELSTKVFEGGGRGHPRLFLSVNVGNRYLRFSAEGEDCSAAKLRDAVAGLLSNPGVFERWEDAVAEYKARRVRREETRPRRDDVNNGSANRGLRARGKTARTRQKRGERVRAPA